jgi:toxin ParE1/3/4
MNRRHITVAPQADDDMLEILLRTARRFGPLTAERNDRLINQALKDLAVEAMRPQTLPMFHIQHGLYFYHVRYSKRNILPVSERIAKPRHYICFRLPSAMELQVLRVLHERRRFDTQSYAHDG